MIFIKSKKQKAEEEARAEELEQAHAEALSKNRKVDARAAKREEASELGASGGMLSTLQAIYVEQVDQGEMIEESDEHLEDIHADLEGSGSEQRRDKLDASNKEKNDRGMLGKFASGVKGAFGAVGDAFGSVKETLSGKFGLVLLGGALVLMNKFSDELFGPEGALTKLLKWMKYDMMPAITWLYDKFVVGWDKTWAGVKIAFEWIHGIFTKISDYVNSFDVEGSTPGLDADEMKKLQDDLIDKAGKLIVSIIGSVWDNVNKVMLAFFAVGGIGYALMKGFAYRAAAGAALGTVVKKPSVIKGALKSLVVGTSAFSSVGGTTAAAALKPGQAINKLGSIYNTSTGRIVTPASRFAHLTRYPRLLKAARKIPLLGPVLSGALAVSVMTNDELSHDEKVSQMGGIIGGGLGSIGFGLAGGMIGSAFPVIGTTIGAIIGSLGGYFGGEWAGTRLAGFLMGGKVEPVETGLDKDNISKTADLESLNKKIASGKAAGQDVTGLVQQRDILASEIESAPKISSNVPGKMQQHMAEYKKAVTSAGTKWTDDMNQDAYNYAVNQISADQNTNNNINYYDGSMGVHQRDMPTNILNSELRYAAGYS